MHLREARLQAYAALRDRVESGRPLPPMSELQSEAATAMVLWEITTNGTVYGRPVEATGIGWYGPMPQATDVNRMKRRSDAS